MQIKYNTLLSRVSNKVQICLGDNLIQQNSTYLVTKLNNYIKP